MSAAPTPAAADELLDREIDVDLDAQAVSAALIELSRQADIQLAMVGDTLDGDLTAGIKGRMTLRAALDRLLPAGRFRYQKTAAATVTIAALPPSAELATSKAELEVIPVPQRETPVPEPRKAPKGRQIEEIVVTAQKREQVSQDVPISMSVMSDVFIKEQGITTIKDALLFVPNFRVVESLGRTSPQCRGFTVSDINPAFEAPCGLALDGVAFSRGSYFSAGLMDLQRIEALRGPQGTTFGKNTTAGVVSLISKDPTDEFSGNVDLQYGLSGPDLRRAEVGVGGPLIPGVMNFRLVGQRELRGAYMENTYHKTDPSVSEDIGNNDRSAYRVKLAFPDVYGAQLKLLHEKTSFFYNGFEGAVYPTNQATANYIRQYDPNAEFGENYKGSNLGNTTIVETTRNQAELNFAWADWSITGVGGFGKLYNVVDTVNVIPTPYPLGSQYRIEESPYITGELRAVSPDFDGLLGLESLFGRSLGTSNVLFGIFGQQNEIAKLDSDSNVYVEGLAIIILGGQNITLPIGTLLATLRQNGVSVQESFHMRFSQKANTEALFGQLTWDMSDKWSASLGGRLSQERKTAHWNLFYSQPAPLFNTTGDRGFIKDKSISKDNFQPKISVTYRLNDDINLFAHWARAFKSGGFNANVTTGDPERPNRTNTGTPPGSLTYDDESGTDWGFDIKTRLFDNTMQLNLSLFRLDVQGFQVLTEVLGTKIPGTTTYLPNGYQQVVNAGHAVAQGAELDLTWLATDWLTVIGALGYNDTEYISFPLDGCSTGETADPETGKCDHSDKPFRDTPKLTGTLSLDSRFPLGGLWSALGDTQFLLGTTVEYVGPYYGGSYNDYDRQPANKYRYRAHAGLANDSQGWSLRISALNLTDDYFGSRGGDPASGTVIYVPQAPRSFLAQFNWNY